MPRYFLLAVGGISFACISIDAEKHASLIDQLQQTSEKSVDTANVENPSFENTHYVILNGDDSYIDLLNTPELMLNWKKSWSFSLEVVYAY